MSAPRRELTSSRHWLRAPLLAPPVFGSQAHLQAQQAAYLVAQQQELLAAPAVAAPCLLSDAFPGGGFRSQGQWGDAMGEPDPEEVQHDHVDTDDDLSGHF